MLFSRLCAAELRRLPTLVVGDEGDPGSVPGPEVACVPCDTIEACLSRGNDPASPPEAG